MLHWMIRLSLIFVKKRVKKQLKSNLNRRSFDKITSRLECVYYLERVVLAYEVCIHIIWYFLWNFTHSKKVNYIKHRMLVNIIRMYHMNISKATILQLQTHGMKMFLWISQYYLFNVNIQASWTSWSSFFLFEY